MFLLTELKFIHVMSFFFNSEMQLFIIEIRCKINKIQLFFMLCWVSTFQSIAEIHQYSIRIFSIWKLYWIENRTNIRWVEKRLGFEAILQFLFLSVMKIMFGALNAMSFVGMVEHDFSCTSCRDIESEWTVVTICSRWAFSRLNLVDILNVVALKNDFKSFWLRHRMLNDRNLSTLF